MTDTDHHHHQHGHRHSGAAEDDYTDLLELDAEVLRDYAAREPTGRRRRVVFRFCVSQLGDQDTAEDVTGDVFAAAFAAYERVRPDPAGVRPWLFRIARNAVVDHYRRRKPQSPLDAVAQHSSDDDPARDFLGKEQDEELQLLVQHLSREQREVLLLRFAGDLSFSEIASTLKKNEPAIRMLLHRGLRKLKTVMDDE